MGVPSDKPILGLHLRSRRRELPAVDTGRLGYLTWVPRLMAIVGYSPFADLTGAEVSQKKSTWTNNDKDLNAIAGARLNGANLRCALAPEAFLAGADLSGADLSGADLTGVNLRGAKLAFADLHGANLIEADLQDADLSSANLTDVDFFSTDLSRADLIGAHLSGAKLNVADLSDVRLADADLTYTDFQGVKNLNLETLQTVRHWERAFYDDDTLDSLGLSHDHNVKLYDQRMKEKKVQSKQIR
ncbi:MAG TPA: pentapeptide repeat-containing protein [Candidatus Sulfotelmatobacter sp.]|nr:pentapeptide repeat-containing protein [Candidatus Sulfotelmatobacter sp.]